MRSWKKTCFILLSLLLIAFSAPVLAAHPVGRARYLERSAQAGTVKNGEVVFAGTNIVVPVVAVAPKAPDTTFEIHGRVDPTIVLPAGARVRFVLGNNDSGMPHGLSITRKAPPYPDNVQSEITSPIAGTAGYVDPENPKGNKIRIKRTQWFTLKRGIYYYVCPVPEHAHKGMYGRILVQ